MSPALEACRVHALPDAQTPSRDSPPSLRVLVFPTRSSAPGLGNNSVLYSLLSGYLPVVALLLLLLVLPFLFQVNACIAYMNRSGGSELHYQRYSERDEFNLLEPDTAIETRIFLARGGGMYL